MNLDNLSNISDTTDVSHCFDVPNLHHLSFGRLKVLWEAGFLITGIKKTQHELDTTYTIEWVRGNTYYNDVSYACYNLWCQILEQLQDEPAKLLNAFSVAASTVNELLDDVVFRRSICCISAERKYSNIPYAEQNLLNKRNTDTLGQQLKETGRLVIKLQGMFREQDEYGNTVDNPDEISYLVISNKNEDAEVFKQDMFKLGQQYNQNSILLRDKDSPTGYYLGCCEVASPDTFAPGLGKIHKIGYLLAYRMLDYCSAPFKHRAGNYTPDKEDAFSFDTEGVVPPAFNSSLWKRVDSNLYTHIVKGVTFYRWKVIKNGIIYGGISSSSLLADRLISKVRHGKFIPNQYKIGVV